MRGVWIFSRKGSYFQGNFQNRVFLQGVKFPIEFLEICVRAKIRAVSKSPLRLRIERCARQMTLLALHASGVRVRRTPIDTDGAVCRSVNAA